MHSTVHRSQFSETRRHQGIEACVFTCFFVASASMQLYFATYMQQYIGHRDIEIFHDFFPSLLAATSTVDRAENWIFCLLFCSLLLLFSRVSIKTVINTFGSSNVVANVKHDPIEHQKKHRRNVLHSIH